MKTGYLKQCIVVSKQIDKHGNGDSKKKYYRILRDAIDPGV